MRENKNKREIYNNLWTILQSISIYEFTKSTVYFVILLIYRYFHNAKIALACCLFMSNWKTTMFKHHIVNKHSESIVKAIQVPYRPQQIFQEA